MLEIIVLHNGKVYVNPSLFATLFRYRSSASVIWINCIAKEVELKDSGKYCRVVLTSVALRVALQLHSAIMDIQVELSVVNN